MLVSQTHETRKQGKRVRGRGRREGGEREERGRRENAGVKRGAGMPDWAPEMEKRDCLTVRMELPPHMHTHTHPRTPPFSLSLLLVSRLPSASSLFLCLSSSLFLFISFSLSRGCLVIPSHHSGTLPKNHSSSSRAIRLDWGWRSRRLRICCRRTTQSINFLMSSGPNGLASTELNPTSR